MQREETSRKGRVGAGSERILLRPLQPPLQLLQTQPTSHGLTPLQLQQHVLPPLKLQDVLLQELPLPPRQLPHLLAFPRLSLHKQPLL